MVKWRILRNVSVHDIGKLHGTKNEPNIDRTEFVVILWVGHYLGKNLRK